MSNAVQDWTTSPLVLQATKRAGAGAETVDILNVLLDLMVEVEEMVPGVPFREIFQATSEQGSTQEGRTIVGYALLDKGLTKYEVDEIMGGRTRWGRGTAETANLKARRHPALELHAEGLTPTQIAQRLGCGRSRVYQVLDRARKKGWI